MENKIDENLENLNFEKTKIKDENKNLSTESKYHPQITECLRQDIEKVIKEYELQFNINIFFAVDTGSRANGVAVPSSDFDLNGFFIPDYKEYLKVIRKSDVIISKQGKKFTSEGKTYEIDIVLWDIKEWFKEKLDKNNLGLDFMLYSPLVYRNNHPDIIDRIKNILHPPFYYFWGKLKNNYASCVKEAQQEGTQNKKLMNMLIYSLQYLYTRLFNSFPCYNIFSLINKFESEKENVVKQLTEEEMENVNICYGFIGDCYEEKMKGRKSLTKVIPDCVTKFNELLDNKFNGKKDKLSIENPWTCENAQNIFDDILAYYK